MKFLLRFMILCHIARTQSSLDMSEMTVIIFMINQLGVKERSKVFILTKN